MDRIHRMSIREQHFPFLHGAPSCTLSHAVPRGPSFGCLRLGKHVYRTVPPSDLNDGLALPIERVVMPNECEGSIEQAREAFQMADH
jgi:hypothetical protein